MHTYHRGLLAAAALITTGCLIGTANRAVSAQAGRKMNVAHRGASGHAPEHTVAAYKLALEQGADYVEQDLQITKDGVVVCLHDLTLERTTNVEEVFPDRGKPEPSGRKTWHVSDFTLAEIKSLDAGSWFRPEFKGERVPTFQEAIDLVKGKAGLYPETKGPEVYASRGFDMETLVLAQLAKNGLSGHTRTDTAKSGVAPVIIQSFSPASLQKMKKAGTTLPLVLLLSDGDPMAGRWLTDAGLKESAQFAVGIGPAKSLLLTDPTLITRAHAAGLTVTPYTFRAAGQPAGKSVKDEMADFLYRIGVDALFTDDPDQFPRR